MASNLNILTSQAKVIRVETDYFSPTSTVYGVPIGTTYAFLGQEDPWPTVGSSETPIQPTEDQSYLKKTFKNMFAAKLINNNNISPVIARIDWANNTNRGISLTYCRLARLGYAGHKMPVYMSKSRIPNIILPGEVDEGFRRPGRPKKSFREGLRNNDLKAFQLWPEYIAQKN